MANLMKKFEKWIMSYTYSERRTKQLFMFNDELRHYSAMDKDIYLIFVLLQNPLMSHI